MPKLTLPPPPRCRYYIVKEASKNRDWNACVAVPETELESFSTNGYSWVHIYTVEDWFGKPRLKLTLLSKESLLDHYEVTSQERVAILYPVLAGLMKAG